MNPKYTTTKAEGITEKIGECSFFLSQMAEHESRNDVKKYGYCLSAFLSAFRTTIYRLTGVVRATRDKAASDALQVSLESAHDIRFLKDATNLEVHGDGPKLWQVRIASRSDKSRFTSRFGRHSSRFNTRPVADTTREEIGFIQFAKHPTEIGRLCLDALEQLKQMAERELQVTTTSL